MRAYHCTCGSSPERRQTDLYFGEEIKNSGLHVGGKQIKLQRKEDVSGKIFS